MVDKSDKAKAPLTLDERRAFMKLPLAERRRILARQAKEMAAHYEKDMSWKDLETGDIVDG